MDFSLSLLQKEQEAIIVGFSADCKQDVRQRLLDLGFVRGSKIKVENVSPLHDPVAYTIHNTQIALRKADALCVLVKLINDDETNM